MILSNKRKVLMDTLTNCVDELVIANLILTRERKYDVFGRVSVRHPVTMSFYSEFGG